MLLVARQNSAIVDRVKTLEDLADHGGMGAVMPKLGLDGCALRCVSKKLSQCSLPHAVTVAAAVLRARPSVPFNVQKPCKRVACDAWTEETVRKSCVWREYWASLVVLLDQAPVNVLLDAHAIALDEHCKAFTKFKAKRCGHRRAQCIRVERSRRVLQYVIQDRLWDVCCSKDVYRDEKGLPVTDYMSPIEARDTVRRMLEDTRTPWGKDAFHFTKYGWLEFTPFLLAAERQNLPLVRYLYDVFPNAVTVDATSQAGNNAYALCKAWLERTKHTPKMIEESELLRYLSETGMSQRPHVDEYACIAAKRPADVCV